MTNSISNQPAPEWLRELAHGRAAYEELLGWPVSLNVSGRVLTLATGAAVSAVTMPALLGAMVRDELGTALAYAPVVADPDGLSWTFLTRPSGGPASAGSPVRELISAGVAITPPGGHVVVPTSPTGRSGIRAWQWVDRPAPGRALPPAHPVVAATRRLTAHRQLAVGA